MKFKEFKVLLGDLRNGILKPGDELNRLARYAGDNLYELRAFTEALLEAYERACTDRTVARELLRQYDLRGRQNDGTHPLRGKASPTSGNGLPRRSDPRNDLK